ncbi:MAG: metallophosphoesterase [Oscillospiraceae bacterium]|jgi:predicted phosphodiesterase|nr:metallophosphoesterase [Oscillospiraceae bacterium]
MKKIFAILMALALCAAGGFGAFAAQDPADAGLKFHNGVFTIIQVSDLQQIYVSSPATHEFLWDLAAREQPDLFVLTGDNIADAWVRTLTHRTAKFWVRRSIDAYMDVFDRIYDQYGTKVTMVFGNHDAEGSGVTRAEEMEMYQAHRSFVGYDCGADTGSPGDHYGAHNLLIKNSSGSQFVYHLWFFDTGGPACDGVRKPAIDWFNRTNRAVGKLPSLAFQHIIVPEIWDALPKGQKAGQPLPASIKGVMRETPCNNAENDGQYEALRKAGNVKALFVGHDHVNTYEIRREGMPDLVNSPSSGFGAYGDLDLRGVRLIRLREDDLSDYQTEVITYLDFYQKNDPEGWLRVLRLAANNSLKNFGIVPDILFFIPALWVVRAIAR